MAITRTQGDLLRAPVAALVNPVNTRGVMGRGLAAHYKARFPDNFAAYRAACAAGELTIGRVLVVVRDAPPRWILNVPTKDHWRRPSTLAYVEAGLAALVDAVRAHGIPSLALPALGCGLGGLRWEEVAPRIEAAFAALPEVEVLLFSPQ